MLLFADTETTGLPSWDLPADDPSQPRIAAIAMVLATDDGRVVDVHHQLVKPEGWSMPAEALRVNGLSDAILAEHGRPMGGALERFNQYLDLKPTIVGHNIRFDAKLIRGELRRAGLPDRFDETKIGCTMKEATPICRLPPTDRMMASGRRGFKAPNLAEAIRHFFGERLPDAHDCLFDALACRRIWLAIQKAKGAAA